jgi:hypothetical protein
MFNFWDIDESNRVDYSEDIRKIAEDRIGFSLPEEYISILKIRNGGYFDPCFVEIQNLKFHLVEILGIGTHQSLDSLCDGLPLCYYLAVNRRINENIAVFSYMGQMGFGFDTSYKSDMPIVCFNSDVLGEPILYKVADNFAGFLSLVQPDTQC